MTRTLGSPKIIQSASHHSIGVYHVPHTLLGSPGIQVRGCLCPQAISQPLPRDSWRLFRKVCAWRSASLRCQAKRWWAEKVAQGENPLSMGWFHLLERSKRDFSRHWLLIFQTISLLLPDRAARLHFPPCLAVGYMRVLATWFHWCQYIQANPPPVRIMWPTQHSSQCLPLIGRSSVQVKPNWSANSIPNHFKEWMSPFHFVDKGKLKSRVFRQESQDTSQLFSQSTPQNSWLFKIRNDKGQIHLKLNSGQWLHSGRIISKDNQALFILLLQGKIIGYLQQVHVSPFQMSVPENTNLAWAPAMKCSPADIQTCINIIIC